MEFISQDGAVKTFSQGGCVCFEIWHGNVSMLKYSGNYMYSLIRT